MSWKKRCKKLVAQKPLKSGDKVQFEVKKTEKGTKATNVKKL